VHARAFAAAAADPPGGRLRPRDGGGADASAAAPRLLGTPVVTYATASNSDNGRFVSIGALVHLDRRRARQPDRRAR
jgi:hypothetical protein